MFRKKLCCLLTALCVFSLLVFAFPSTKASAMTNETSLYNSSYSKVMNSYALLSGRWSQYFQSTDTKADVASVPSYVVMDAFDSEGLFRDTFDFYSVTQILFPAGSAYCLQIRGVERYFSTGSKNWTFNLPLDTGSSSCFSSCYAAVYPRIGDGYFINLDYKIEYSWYNYYYGKQVTYNFYFPVFEKDVQRVVIVMDYDPDSALRCDDLKSKLSDNIGSSLTSYYSYTTGSTRPFRYVITEEEIADLVVKGDVITDDPFVDPADKPTEDSGGDPSVNVDLSETNGLLGGVKDILSSIGTSISNLAHDISESVISGISSIFVPEEGYLDEKFLAIKEKFSFFEGVRTTVEQLKASMESYSDSNAPAVTVDLGNATSSHFNGGGVVTVLDLSFLSPYRSRIRGIISAFLWLFFIWRVYVHLPGIIGGTGGDVGFTSLLEGEGEIRRNKKW